MAKDTYKQSNNEHKHTNTQQPEWLLILEVTTGVLVVVCIVTGTATAVRTCNPKSFTKIPWKETRSWKDETSIPIG